VTRRLLLALLLAACAASARAASAQGSPFVPLDDPTYHYLAALQARGHLEALSALEKPYTVAAVQRALAAARARHPGRVAASWLEHAERAVARWAPAADSSGIPVVMGLALLGTAQTSARRELMLPDDLDGVYPGAQLRVAAGVGPLVVAGHGFLDNRLKVDPEFAGRQDRAVSGRVEDAYLGAQWKYGELFAGRLARSWGPGPLDGLQLGAYAYTYDHVYGRFGTDQLRLQTLLARLDDTPGTFAPEVQRYLAMHRLAGRWRGLELAATETYVYSGTARGFEWSVSNPLAPFLLTQYNEREEGNFSVGVEAALHTRAGLYGLSVLVDDFQVDECDPLCAEPSSYGVTATAEGIPFVGEQRLFASYTRISSLTYRTPEAGERYAWQGVSLGRGFSDYEEARAGVDLALLSELPLRAYVALRRQGEGDYRAPFPAPEAYGDTPGFLIGRVTRVTRVGVSGGGALPLGIFLSADLGVNAASGDEAVRPATGFVGRVRISVEPRALVARFVVR
jgi:hypothetical protein